MPPSDDAYADLLADLEAEHAALDAVVAPLDADDWERPTPAAGWAVRDQIAHLNFFDEQAVLSAEDVEAFRAGRERAFNDFASFEETTLAFGRRVAPDELLGAWRSGRAAMVMAFRELGAGDRLEWYGPPMSAMSFATARLMETWAHGQDVVDAVGDPGGAWAPSDRLRHIAHLGVRTRGFSYVVRGREAPEGEVRVELASPSGELWEWGPADAPDRVTGPAVDFCLLVTQRRHRDDTALVATGPRADEWLSLAQAFAGGPGEGRPPLG